MKHIIQQLLESDDAFATTLLIASLDEFGTECLGWLPQALRLELSETFNANPSIMAMDRLMAGIAILTTNAFQISLPTFNEFCGILSGEPHNPEFFVPIDAASAAWGITESLLIHPPEGDDHFSEDITAYIAALLKQEGIITPPDVLRIAHLHMPKVESLDFSDDPEMFEAVFSVEKGKTDEINRFVKSMLSELVKQLASLQLQHGSTANIAEKMMKSLPSQ